MLVVSVLSCLYFPIKESVCLTDISLLLSLIDVCMLVQTSIIFLYTRTGTGTGVGVEVEVEVVKR